MALEISLMGKFKVAPRQIPPLCCRRKQEATAIMSPALVRVLYQSLLSSARQLELDANAGRTLYNALRSGAIATYDGVKIDWQRERRYENRLQDAKVLQRWSTHPVTAATLVRTQFDRALEAGNRLELHHRLDSAFDALREIDDHNALIRDLAARGAYVSKRRSPSVRFRIGDIVEVNEMGVGVVVAWSEARAHAYGELHVTYDVLPDTAYHSDSTRLHRVPQNELRAAGDPKPVQHPSVLIHFDDFSGGRHIPCTALAQRYPDDAAEDNNIVTAHSTDSTNGSVPEAPSIMQLQFADEDKLVRYLRCDDSTVIQFATAALEGKWISDAGEDAQHCVREALRQMDQGDLSGATHTLASVVARYPDFAFAWSKLGTAELNAGNATKALEHYERALQLKPQMVDALAGLGTCATRLRRWHLAHSAAMQLLRVQPGNETARLLLDNAILSSL